jgi:uncharacterized protein YjdB/PKD repeat protein
MCQLSGIVTIFKGMKKIFIVWIVLLTIFYQSTAQNTESYSWNNVAIGGGGFVSGVFFSPIEQNVIYTRTDVGGAYRWNEANQSWISLMDWVSTDERGLLGVEALAIDPATPGKVYMMTGTVYWNQADDGIGSSAFLRSSDYGQTWEKIPVWNNSTKYFNVHGNGMGRGNGERLAIDPANSNTMFYGTRNKGLWKSTDNGNTWSKVSSFPVDTTWNGAGISFVAYDPSNTSRIYVGVLRKADNIFISEDGGVSWDLIPNMPQPTYDGSASMGLMPQRIAIRPDGSSFYITTGNGAGPHTMQWDEGWGEINDWFNRGTVYRYDLATGNWTDISPQNFIDPDESDNPYDDPSTYFGNYSGISIDPNNPDHMVVSSISSWRGPQFWNVDGTWYDEWGDNIFVSEDGGESWVPSFEYYWLDGGYYPNTEQMDENGIDWMVRSTIHWIGSVAIDPFNPQRVFVTSGNGVFKTENILNYEWNYTDEWGNSDTSYTQYTVWQVASHGIEETVPEEVVSIPGGPLVSVIGDYDGFVHTDITESPENGRHEVEAAGSMYSLGSTTGLAYAPQSGRLAKCAKVRSVSGEYTTTPIGPVQWSDDNGITWTTEVYTSNPPTDLIGGKVALSADGEITLWMPSEGNAMYRSANSQWTTVSGVSFNCRPVGDQVDANTFYAYNNANGYMYVSTDKGVSFSQAGFVGESNFRNAVAVPENKGHVWAPVANDDETGALMYSVDSGSTFTAVDGVGYCEAVGFGKAATGADYPTIFTFADIDGIRGIWRSIDRGESWVRVNDDNHEYGGLANGEFVVGDMNVFGRVYMSTAGRGIAYGDPLGSLVPVTGVAIESELSVVSIGSALQLEAIITPTNASNHSVTWNSGNDSIATVNSNGIVTGVSEGTVSITVTASDGGYIANLQITVVSVPVEGISISQNSIVLDPGYTYQLSATISPEDATNQGVMWSSSDESIAGVDNTGLVTAISYGDAVITATSEDGGFTSTCNVTVNYVEIPVTGVELTPSNLLLGIDEARTLVVTVLPATANDKTVSWSSDNESVATVDEDGTVTGIAEGSVVISVTTNDGGYSATCNVTVSEITKGTILAEYWDDLTGSEISDLTGSSNFPDNPTSREYLTSLEGATNRGDNYGTRLRGYIYPPVTGSYTFWIAGDDYCDLYLSADETSENADRIAYVEGYTNSQEWTKYESQESAAIELVAGQQYYIEVLHKEGSGGDNIAVAWEGPDIGQVVIDGSYLSPYSIGETSNIAPVAVITASTTSGTVPLTVTFDASSSYDTDGDDITYSWDLGDGNTSSNVTVENTYTETGSYTVVLTVSDDSTSDEASVVITVADEGVTQFNLLTSVTGSGSIELVPSGGVYDSATVVAATAVPSSGYHFVSWSGSVTSESESVDIIMDADKSITVTFEQDSIGEPCENPVSISIPFSQDGVGEYCYVTSTEIASINSWNMEAVEINGLDYTNTWSNDFPAAIDGQWFIYYKGNYSWSHLEISGPKSVAPVDETSLSESVVMYPNPFSSIINLSIKNPESICSIEIMDNLGRLVTMLGKTAIEHDMEIGDALPKGIYYLRVNSNNTNYTFIINKF